MEVSLCPKRPQRCRRANASLINHWKTFKTFGRDNKQSTSVQFPSCASGQLVNCPKNWIGTSGAVDAKFHQSLLQLPVTHNTQFGCRCVPQLDPGFHKRLNSFLRCQPASKYHASATLFPRYRVLACPGRNSVLYVQDQPVTRLSPSGLVWNSVKAINASTSFDQVLKTLYVMPR